MARKAASYSCPFCTYTGEKQENAQIHMRRHLRKIAKDAGYAVIKLSDIQEAKKIVAEINGK